MRGPSEYKQLPRRKRSDDEEKCGRHSPFGPRGGGGITNDDTEEIISDSKNIKERVRLKEKTIIFNLMQHFHLKE